MRVSVLLEPAAGAAPRDATAVVVDVLRATTTLTVALANGARRVVAAGSPEEAFALRSREPQARLCGEREGLRIAGFDLGNSPFEYQSAEVSGRTLVFASTNGSLAIRRARTASRLLLGAFVNASAVAEAVGAAERVLVVCAGKLGGFSFEDAACAGWLCERLAARGATMANPGARFARALAPRDRHEVRALVQGSSHGRYLRGLGPEFARDVEFCADLDRLDRAFSI